MKGARSRRKVKFVGDSVTCGFGVDARKCSSAAEAEDVSKSFAVIDAQTLDLNFSIIGRSGIGVFCDDAGNNVDIITDFYQQNTPDGVVRESMAFRNPSRRGVSLLGPTSALILPFENGHELLRDYAANVSSSS